MTGRTSHLIHVGFPKTGSKLLSKWFSGHPQLAYRTDALAGYANVHQIIREGVSPRPGVLYRVTSAEGFTAPRRDPGHVVVSYNDDVDPVASQQNICASLQELFPDAQMVLGAGLAEAWTGVLLVA